MTHFLERTGSWFKNRYLWAVNEKQMLWARAAYEHMLSIATLGRGVPRLINGRDLIRVSVHHRYVDEIYEPEVFEFFKRELKADDIIFDVGAYIGVYSIILSKYLGARGRIYAFEPAPESVKLLTTHLEMNNAEKSVEVLACGVGERRGSGRLFAIRDHIQNSFSSAAFGEDVCVNALEVPVICLDDFCRERSIVPTFVKVDTEGWELQVLRGAENLLSTRREIRYLVEMHPYAWHTAGYDENIFKEFCARHSLKIEPLSGQRNVFSEYGQVVISAVR